jgi:hypothetical protein
VVNVSRPIVFFLLTARFKFIDIIKAVNTETSISKILSRKRIAKKDWITKKTIITRLEKLN